MDLCKRIATAAGLVGLLVQPALSEHAEPQQIQPPSGRTPAVHLGPRMLDPSEAGIGHVIPDSELMDIDGNTQRLFDASAQRGTVIVVRDPTCPVSHRYGPRVSSLANRYRDSGFRFVFIYPSVDLDSSQRRRDAQLLAVDGLYAERGSFAAAEHLGVKSTGDVFIVDSAHRLRYRGAVDDQYGLGYTRDLPTAHYLRNALDDLSHGRPVQVPATSAPGCYIDADPAMDQLIPTLSGGDILS